MAENKAKGPVKRPSALKRDLQAEKRRLRNRSKKSRIFTEKKKLDSLTNDKKGDQLSLLTSLLDKAAKVGTIHKNKANRLKSRLSHKVNKALA